MRSEPLILNDLGNVKYPKVCQERGMRWLLVLSDEGKRIGKKFNRYRKARQAGAFMLEKHSDMEVTIVSLTVGYGPPASRVSDDQLTEMNERGHYWCPFCRKFRVFDWDPFWDLSRCPVCRVFDSNWHVVYNNPRMEFR